MQVQWTASAESDQEKLIAYITQDSPTPALSQLDEIEGQTRLAKSLFLTDFMGTCLAIIVIQKFSRYS